MSISFLFFDSMPYRCRKRPSWKRPVELKGKYSKNLTTIEVSNEKSYLKIRLKMAV